MTLKHGNYLIGVELSLKKLQDMSNLKTRTTMDLQKFIEDYSPMLGKEIKGSPRIIKILATMAIVVIYVPALIFVILLMVIRLFYRTQVTEIVILGGQHKIKIDYYVLTFIRVHQQIIVESIGRVRKPLI